MQLKPVRTVLELDDLEFHQGLSDQPRDNKFQIYYGLTCRSCGKKFPYQGKIPKTCGNRLDDFPTICDGRLE